MYSVFRYGRKQQCRHVGVEMLGNKGYADCKTVISSSLKLMNKKSQNKFINVHVIQKLSKIVEHEKSQEMSFNWQKTATFSAAAHSLLESQESCEIPAKVTPSPATDIRRAEMSQIHFHPDSPAQSDGKAMSYQCSLCSFYHHLFLC